MFPFFIIRVDMIIDSLLRLINMLIKTNRAYRDTLGCFSISKVVIIYDFILYFKNIFNDNQVLY